MEKIPNFLVFFDFDFNIYNEKNADSNEDDDNDSHKDNSTFTIQMFGINEIGETCSIIVEDYKPFFYVQVDETWSKTTKTSFLEHIKLKMGRFYENSIVDCKIIQRKKLYGFDGGKEHKFIMFKFTNMFAFNKAKYLWYKNKK